MGCVHMTSVKLKDISLEVHILHLLYVIRVTFPASILFILYKGRQKEVGMSVFKELSMIGSWTLLLFFFWIS